MSLDQGGHALPSLLSILNDNSLKPGSSITSVVNSTTIDLLRRLLSRDDYVDIAEKIRNRDSDVMNLLEFTLHVLRHRYLSNRDANMDIGRRARRLMFKIISRTPVVPRSFIVTGVSMPDKRDYIGRGAYGNVFKGELCGTVVALKVLYKNDANNLAFCREALMWGSLKHNFVLPFIGIHKEEDGMAFLVSPYMKNGTLAQWRKNTNPLVPQITERILEVAQGIEYIHSEGVVHGDIRGENVLLDADLHVQIADFGLTRLLDATNTRSGAKHLNFAAPELFGCPEDADDLSAEDPLRTQMSDIYAFGCIYYEIHYDSIPFAGRQEIQVVTLVSRGKRPPRQDEPPLSDEAWKLIQQCWVTEPLKRPRMKDIAEQMNAVSLHENPAYYSWWQAPQATIIPTDSEGPIWDIKTLLHEINARHDDWVVDDCEIGPFPGSAIVESDVNCTDDDFEQLDMLGDGTRGIVHKVIEKRSGKIMARKTITTHDAPMKQLLRELQNISSNKHPNIVYFFGAYMSPSTGEIKILTEFCEGGSLDAVCKEIKKLGAVVGEMVVARIAEGVLQGLAYLHSRKTIHRDIKPSNILLSFDGIVKLCDFGASGELVGSLAGTFIGTAMYMAPERISGADYTIRSDVWSMGISLLELAQNRFPFPNDVAPIELIMHITRGTPPTLEDEPGITWSDEIKDFIKHALTHDQAIRPAPKEMLVHPWIVYAMKKDVHMAKWVRQLWKGKKIKKR